MEVLKGMGKITAHRERKMALKLWSLLHEGKLSELAKAQFDETTAEVYFNTSSGNVFLSDDDFNTIMESGGELDLFISTPSEGHEGYFDELMDDWDMHDQDDKEHLHAIATEKLRTKHAKEFKDFE